MRDIEAILQKTNLNFTKDTFNEFCPFLLFNIELEHCKLLDEKSNLEQWQGEILRNFTFNLSIFNNTDFI